VRRLGPLGHPGSPDMLQANNMFFYYYCLFLTACLGVTSCRLPLWREGDARLGSNRGGGGVFCDGGGVALVLRSPPSRAAAALPPCSQHLSLCLCAATARLHTPLCRYPHQFTKLGKGGAPSPPPNSPWTSLLSSRGPLDPPKSPIIGSGRIWQDSGRILAGVVRT